MNLLASEGSNASVWVLLLLFMSVTVVFSFLCSIAEAVLLSVTRPFIKHLSEEKPKAASRLSSLKQDIDQPLAAILTLNTIAHTAGASLAGAQGAILWPNNIEKAVFLTIFTLIVLVGSEIIPKTIGALYWKQLAPMTASFVNWLMWALHPFVWLSKAITKRLGTSGHGHSFSREEFRAMAEIASSEGHMDEQESKMLRNLFVFRDTKVASIMTPRPVVFMVPGTMTVQEYVDKHSESPFSRVPIYGRNRDEVKGFVLKVQILQALSAGEQDQTMDDLSQSIRTVPETTTVMALLARMTGKREHITLVVDEFGAVQGIVTLEDLVETLIGFEIVDETDLNVDMQKVARDLWETRAKRIGLQTELAETKDDTRSSESAS